MIDLKLAKKTQSQKPRWALTIVTLHAAVESRAVDKVVQRSQPALACRPISSFPIRDPGNRSQENDPEKKGVKRDCEQLNDRSMLHG